MTAAAVSEDADTAAPPPPIIPGTKEDAPYRHLQHHKWTRDTAEHCHPGN